MTSPARRKPRYLELAEHFIARIASGEFAVGSLLPTELEICAHFSVSRHTARAALAQLISAGLVSRRAGAGTRVLTSHSAIRYQHEVDNIEDLLQYGTETRLEVHQSQQQRADAELALQLGIASGSLILRIAAIRYEEPSQVAVAVTDVALPLVRGLPVERLLDHSSAPRTIARLLDPARLSRVEQVFDAGRFNDAEAAALGVPAGSVALRVQRHDRDTAGRVAAFSTSLHPAGRFAYRMVLTRRGG
jgi:DNA-binding GntR family transcriptional regulator